MADNIFQNHVLDDMDEPKDWVSAPNVVRTDKTLVVKDFFTVNDHEASLNRGQKIHITTFNSTITSTYTAQLSDFMVLVSSVAVPPTVNLPPSKLAGIGKYYVVKDASGSALSTTITIAPNGTEVIDGDTTKVINSNFGVARLYSDGSNWFTF